jgi:hypothetical protein
VSEPILQLVRGEREAVVCCADHDRPKQLGRMTAHGLHIWCKASHDEVVIPWQLVDAARERITSALSSAEVNVVVATLSRIR